LGTGVLGYYSMPQEIIQRLSLIPAAISNVVYSEVSRNGHNDNDSHSKRQKMIAIYALMVAICIYLFWELFSTIAFSEMFSKKTYVIIMIMAVGFIFNSLAQLPYSRLLGIGAARLTSIIHFTELVLYLPILIFLTKSHGINGAAFAWTIRMIADFIILWRFDKILSNKQN
jgi:O-antigen/teichoic acid export membrane protein